MRSETTKERIARLCMPGVRLFTVNTSWSTPELKEIQVFHKAGRYVMIGDPNDSPHECKVVNWKRIVFPTDYSDYYETPEDAWNAAEVALKERLTNFYKARIAWRDGNER